MFVELNLLFVESSLEDGLESSTSFVPSFIGALSILDEIPLEKLYSSSKLSLVRLFTSHFIIYMEFLPCSPLDLCLPKVRHIVCHH